MRVQLPLSGLYLGFCWSPNGLHALAVGVDRDPAGSVRGYLLAQEVVVFARLLDVLGAVLGKLFGGPRDAQFIALVQPRPLTLPAHGGAEPG